MASNPNDTPLLSLRERFFKSWFPPAAVVGGLAALIGAGLRARPVPKPAPPVAGGGGRTPGGTVLPVVQSSPSPRLEREYRPSGAIGAAVGAPAFQHALAGIAVDASDQVHALGDGEVRVFGADGRLIRQWRTAATAESLAVGPDGRVYVGGAGRVDIYDRAGTRMGGFTFGNAGEPPMVSAIDVFGADILVADASARIIRRFDAAGRQRGLIGDQSKTKSFILPNGRLDLAVDASGVVHATDTGRHQVTAWALDGTPVGRFGKFGMSDPADFVGCCNPVNLALAPDGTVVTAEKMIARVKVFEPGGRLLALIGPEHFDRMCTQIHVAVDSHGRILAADPVRRTITVFARVVGKGGDHE